MRKKRRHNLPSVDLVSIVELSPGGFTVLCSCCGQLDFASFAPFDDDLDGLEQAFDEGVRRVNPLTGRMN